MEALKTRLQNNSSIPSFVVKENALETCFNLKRLQNNIRLRKNIINFCNSNDKFLSLDTEAYEKNQDYITEIGWVIFKKNGSVIHKKHRIVSEYLSFRNGRYVEDNKDNFNFGESKIQKLNDIIKELNNDLKTVDYVVGQGINNDILSLKKVGVNLSKFNSELYDFHHHSNGIIDTQDIYAGKFLERPIGLEKGLIKLSIPYSHLHNAGNDAYYTMRYFLKLLEHSLMNENKYQEILNISIPSDYREEDYVRYKKNKNIQRKIEKQNRKNQRKRRNNYNSYFNDDDDNDYYNYDNYNDYDDYYDYDFDDCDRYNDSSYGGHYFHPDCEIDGYCPYCSD